MSDIFGRMGTNGSIAASSEFVYSHFASALLSGDASVDTQETPPILEEATDLAILQGDMVANNYDDQIISFQGAIKNISVFGSEIAIFDNIGGTGDETDGIDGTDGADGTDGIDASGDSISDADGDTRIEVEKNADEDIIRFFANDVEMMNINRVTGRVGIGSPAPASPGAALEVLGPAGTFVRVASSGGGQTVGFEFRNAGITHQAFQLDNAQNLVFRNTAGTHGGSVYFDYENNCFFRDKGSTTVLTIASTKRIGINTTGPSTDLHVNGPIRCGQYTVLTVPSASASGAGSDIYVTDETGGAVKATSDGTNWRRSTDRAIIS